MDLKSNTGGVVDARAPANPKWALRSLSVRPSSDGLTLSSGQGKVP